MNICLHVGMYVWVFIYPRPQAFSVHYPINIHYITSFDRDIPGIHNHHTPSLVRALADD